MTKLLSGHGLLSAASLLGALCLCGSAGAQCTTYTITSGTGGTITPGVTDVGNHVDDGVTAGIAIPFGFNFYGTTYNTVNVSSNGNVQFATSATPYTNVCPQANQGAFGPAIFCFWDDLYTSGAAAGQGIFTTTSGATPNRRFYIEYRTQFCCSTAAPIVNFELVLKEEGGFDIIYHTNGDARVGGNSATIGTQDGAGNIQSFNCNSEVLTDGTVLSFSCPPTSQPRCSLSAGPTSGYAGATFAAHATVIQGTPATPPYTVTLDASSVGAGTVSLFDDGNPAHADATAGDLVYSNNVTVSGGATPGTYAVTSTVTDSANPAESSTCSVSFVVLDPTVWSESANGGGDTGSLPASAQAVNLPAAVQQIRGTVQAGNDADMYMIHICDPANFSATTVGGATYDTQLWLFTTDGHGIAMDDDEGVQGGTLQSRLTNMFTASLPPGDYLLAMTGYNQDALDSGNALIFNNTETTMCFGTQFRCEHGPDGPGGANALDHWDTGSANLGAYTIALTGVGGAACGPRCGSADFNCDGDTGTDADIEAFFACLAGNCPAAPCPNNADFNADGDTGTDADIEAFFRVLAGGTC